MKIVEHDLAMVAAAPARQRGDVRLVRPAGTHPTPRHTASVEQSPTDDLRGIADFDDRRVALSGR